MPLIGTHVSSAGGVRNAPIFAHQEGCETFQFFVSPPQTYKVNEISDEEVAAYKKNCKQYGFTEAFVHAQYLINLASPNNRIRYGSINLLQKGLEACNKLGVKGLMFHTGTATGQPSRSTAMKNAIESLNKVLDGYDGSTKLLIENAAGAGATLGKTFKEVGRLLHGVKNQSKIGVCLDTQHSFASGYDWRTSASTNKALQEFSKEIGMRKLYVVHVNDSKVDCGTNRDRHEHIGKGKIGKQGFDILINHPKLKNKPFILETPPQGREGDMAVLKRLRKK